MERTTKRVFCLLLALAMVLSAGVSAFAYGSTVTVYCQAPEEWETCYVYWWGSTESVVWPGAVMTQRSDGLWYYDVPTDATNLIFNNSYEYSLDLDMPTGDKVKYVYDSDSWEIPYGGNTGSVTPGGSIGGSTGSVTPGGSIGGSTDTPDTVTVYCQAPEEWETCYVYWWGSTESVVWPGKVMTQRSDGLWYYAVPTDATNLIFNNSYEYSPELDMPTDNKVRYVFLSGSWESSDGGLIAVETDPVKILEAASRLQTNEELPYDVTLSGEVTVVNEAYNEELFPLITVTILVTGTSSFVRVFWMSGDGIDKIAVGDTITVKGRIQNFAGTIELINGTMINRIPADQPKDDNDNTEPDDNTGDDSNNTTAKPDLPKDNNDSVLTLWAKVPSAWTTVNAYTWDAANTAQNGEWPGTTMTKDGEWYKIVITNKVVNVIINNGADQTPDLKVDSGKDLYVVVGDDKKATVYYADGTTAGDTTPCTHSYETTVISPTCTQPGYALHTCSLCGISYTGGEIPAKGHRFPDFVSDGNATCTKDGTETAVCLGCGKPSTRVETGSALGHSFTTYLYDYNAQCGKDGTETAKCDRCSLTDTRTAAGTALEHTFENGACTSCGAAETAGLVGDVTGDGKINIMDVVKLYAHVKGTPITDEYALVCGDVSGDGKINIMDVVKLYAHVKGVSLVTKPSEEETVPTDKIKLEYAFLLPGKTERYELSIRIGDEVFLKSMTIQPGVSSVTIPLIGSGTVVYDLYVDGEYLRSETVIFASDK